MRHLLTSNLTGQMFRYGVSGVLLTLFYSTVYWTAATRSCILLLTRLAE